jgi:hypothetical protein
MELIPPRPLSEIVHRSSCFDDFEGSRSGWKDRGAAATSSLVDRNDDQDQGCKPNQNQQ